MSIASILIIVKISSQKKELMVNFVQMNKNKNINFNFVLSMLALAALILGVSFLLSGVFNNLNTSLPDKTSKSIEVPTTIPEFSLDTLTKNTAPSCAISDNQVEYISKTNPTSRLQLVDISKPFKDGYQSTKIDYLKNYLSGNQNWNLTDGNNIANVWGYGCEGKTSKELQDTSKETELNLAHVKQSRSNFAIDSISGSVPGIPTFYATAIRGDYAMLLITQSPELNAKQQEQITKCNTSGTIDQSCYEKLILNDDYKPLLYNSAAKAIAEFNF
jgi:hypothetical protein